MQTQSQLHEQTHKRSTYFETRVQQLLLKRARAPEGYHSLLRLVYGDGYDRETAEFLRQQMARGDSSWMPPVRFVGRETLREARGAYDKASDAIFLADDLRPNSWVTAATLLEELGHHLDTRLRTSDTQGDEGEIFRRLLLGEHLSAEELARVRQEDDSGSIVVDGKEIQVEFLGVPKFVKKVGGAVGGAVVSGVKAGAGAVAGAAQAGAGAVADVAQAGAGTVADVVEAGAGAVADVAEAGAGAVADVAQAGAGAVADVAQAGAGAVADVGNKLAEVAASAAGDVWDGTKQVAEWVGQGATWSAVKLVESLQRDLAGTYHYLVGLKDALIGWGYGNYEGMKDFYGGLEKIASGNFSDGVKDLFVGLGKLAVETPVDYVFTVGIESITLIQTELFLEPIGRGLDDAERAELERVFVDSVDYGKVVLKEGCAFLFSLNDRPFTSGNTIYLKDQGPSHPGHMSTLAHEMTHVWQHQHGGSDYKLEALWAQNFGDEYDWEKGVAEGRAGLSSTPSSRRSLSKTLGAPDILLTRALASSGAVASITLATSVALGSSYARERGRPS